MEQELELIKTTFLNYFADGKYFILFLIALIGIALFDKKKGNNIFVYYSFLILILVFNPIFCYILLKVIKTNVYYRFLWLLPIGIVIAHFGTCLISKVNHKVSKIIVLIAFIGIIGSCGKFIYQKNTFLKVNNWYKLPDEYVQVVHIIKDIPLESPKKAMPPTEMVGYIRQIDASIELAYQRQPYENYDEMYAIVNYYQAGDVQHLIQLGEEAKVNIIIYNNTIELSQSLSQYGYQLYAQTEHYDIYVLTEELVSDININEEKILIEGLKDKYKLCFINDLHIIVPDEDVSVENKEMVEQRYNDLFKTSIGEHSSKLWARLPLEINALNSDLVILGGDMVDYISSSNIKCLKSGMQEIKQETMYLRADHDYGTDYNKSLTIEYVNNLQKSIDDNLEVYCKDLGEILIVGINNSTSQISETALSDLKQIFAIGKPIILVTHVPLNSRVDNTLAEESQKNWQNRNLTWDEAGTSYMADNNTKEFLQLVYAENSPVKAVLAAHLHFKNTSKLNKDITQYVFDATYKGEIGVINIVGE